MTETAARTHGYTKDKEALVKRLHRIEGQVRGIEKMVADDRYCIDILTQIGAVTTALESVAFKVLDEHVNHCVAGALASGDPQEAGAKSRELLEAVHRFSRTRIEMDALAGQGQSLNRLAASATTHCLTGCAIGEVLGFVIGTWRGWDDLPTVALAIGLAYLFGYSFTLVPLLRAGLALGAAVGIAFAADTISITIMEIVDNGVILLIPGAMEAGLGDALFWGSLAFALAVAWVFAFPVNRYLIARGRGHAVAHGHH